MPETACLRVGCSFINMVIHYDLPFLKRYFGFGAKNMSNTSQISYLRWAEEPLWFLDELPNKCSDKEIIEAADYDSYIGSNEGLRLKVYDDATGKELRRGDTLKGYPTIGYGRELSMTGITNLEASYLLQNSIAKKKKRLFGELHQRNLSFFNDLSYWRKIVIVDMAYNLGVEGLLGFNQMIEALSQGDWEKAANELKDSTYFNKVKSRGKQNFCIMKFNKYFTDGQALAYFKNR